MQTPSLDPPIADTAPDSEILTAYDEQHLITYVRLLDAETDCADWQEVARLVLHIDPGQEGDRAHKAWVSHLARAHWLQACGYRHLLRGGAPQ